jgi:hypothetical protein
MGIAAVIAGLVMLALGVGGGIRLLSDHGNSGLMGWVPGGFSAQLIAYAVLAVAGLVLAGWGDRERKEHEGRA